MVALRPQAPDGDGGCGMSWSAFWAPAGEALYITAQGFAVVFATLAVVFAIIAVAAAAYWLVVALLTVGDMVREGKIGGGWRK